MADIDGPLPDLDVRGGSTYTVDTGDPGAVITRLVVHCSTPDVPDPVPLPATLLAHTPGPN